MPVPDFTRPTRRRIAVAAIAVTLSLAGCAPAEPTPTITPSASAEPLFSSDKEALAAAEAALTSYWEISDRIAREGGEASERILTVTTEEWATEEADYFEWFRSEGFRQEGAMSFDSLEIQQWFANTSSTTVVIFACFDYTALQVYNSDNSTFEFGEGDRRKLYEVTLQSTPDAPQLRIHNLNVWENRTC